MIVDKEYIVLTEIEKNSNITQRELSKKTELSLGSINILLNKMVREGLIKIKQIPMNRVAYMLTPKGMADKLQKTSTYIKYHYNYINDTKSKIENALKHIQNENKQVSILLEYDEIGEIVKQVADINAIPHSYKIDSIKTECVVVTSSERELSLKDTYRVINLLEKI